MEQNLNTNYDNSSGFFRKLIKLFWQHFEKPMAQDKPHTKYLYKSWPMNGDKFEFDIQELDITETVDDIAQLYEEFGVIVLRKYNGEDKLVIACGNCPLANCGGYPFNDDYEKEEYHAEHHHTGCYTINPAPEYNPSVIGWFSEQTFLNIPDVSFSEIYIEGAWLDGTQIFFDEIRRMLKNGGKLFDISYETPMVILSKDADGSLIIDEYALSRTVRNV